MIFDKRLEGIHMAVAESEVVPGTVLILFPSLTPEQASLLARRLGLDAVADEILATIKGSETIQ